MDYTTDKANQDLDIFLYSLFVEDLPLDYFEIMTDDITGLGKVAEASEKMTREAREFIFKVFGNIFFPASEEGGEWLRDIVCVKRDRWQETSVAAYKKTKLTGRSIQKVDIRLLEPIYKGASLEDSPTVQELWSGCLAAASIGETIDPSYPRIISDMTPKDLEVLSLIDRLERQIINKEIKRSSGIKLEKDHYALKIKSIKKDSNLSDEKLRISFDKLINFGLCRLVGGTMRDIFIYGDYRQNEAIYLTYIGKNFLDVCLHLFNQSFDTSSETSSS